jgi:hypothetical protein
VEVAGERRDSGMKLLLLLLESLEMVTERDGETQELEGDPFSLGNSDLKNWGTCKGNLDADGVVSSHSTLFVIS